MHNNYIVYKVVAYLAKMLGSLVFGGKVVNNHYIPQDGSCILAGNHTSNYDAYLLFKSTNRPIHFLGKIELFKGPMKYFFKIMHLIPVDRSKKNVSAKEAAISVLKEEKVIGIFPEGTYHSQGKKTKDGDLLPFKGGAISFSLKVNAPIVPFAIVGEFKFRSKPLIIFGEPVYAKDIKEADKVKFLEAKVKELLKEGGAIKSK